MADEMGPALARLQTKLQTQLDQVKKTKGAINALHEAFDQPIPYPDVNEDANVRTTIRRGMFYGQPLATCVRTILEMRRAAQLDAASVNEIFAALKEGGYAFETKDDENAKNGLRQSMRKNPIFHRIPSGEWGLLAWYPNAKVDKPDKDEEDDESPAKKEGDGESGKTPTASSQQPATAAKAQKKKSVVVDVSPTVSNEQAASAT